MRRDLKNNLSVKLKKLLSNLILIIIKFSREKRQFKSEWFKNTKCLIERSKDHRACFVGRDFSKCFRFFSSADNERPGCRLQGRTEGTTGRTVG